MAHSTSLLLASFLAERASRCAAIHSMASLTISSSCGLLLVRPKPYSPSSPPLSSAIKSPWRCSSPRGAFDLPVAPVSPRPLLLHLPAPVLLVVQSVSAPQRVPCFDFGLGKGGEDCYTFVLDFVASFGCWGQRGPSRRRCCSPRGLSLLGRPCIGIQGN